MRLLTAISLLAALLASCTHRDDAAKRGSDGRLPLTVSIEPQRALLEEIGGDRVKVTTLLDNGADPETFEPAMATVMALENSAAWLQVGAIPFEHELEERVAQGNSHLVTVNTSDGIELITDSHHHHGEHEEDEDHHHGHSHETDPHTWSSVRNMKVMASNMLEALTRLDPDGAEYYAGRCRLLVARLDSLDAEYTRRLAPARGKAFMVWHPSLSYFARDYGLRQVSVTPDHREISLIQLQDVIDHAIKEGVGLFFEQSSYDPRLSSTVRRHIGGVCRKFDPLDYRWQAGLDSVVSAIETVTPPRQAPASAGSL